MTVPRPTGQSNFVRIAKQWLGLSLSIELKITNRLKRVDSVSILQDGERVVPA
jgi:hypothetical protein